VTDPSQGGSSGGPVARLLGSIGGLLAGVVEVGRSRLELLATEVQEEVRRTATLLVLGCVALFAAGVASLMAGLTLIFAFWDTHRVLVSVLVTLAYGVGAVLAAVTLSNRIKAHPGLLADTLAELRRDRDALRGED